MSNIRAWSVIGVWLAVTAAGCSLRSSDFSGALRGCPTGLPSRVAIIGGTKYVPIDIQRQEQQLTFDRSARLVRGHARMVFDLSEDGVPFFLLQPALRSLRLNGAPVSWRDLTDPGSLTMFRALANPLAASTGQVLELDYELGADDVKWSAQGVGFLSSMDDLQPTGNFWERYGPTGFEEDQYGMSLELELLGASSAHRLFTNGVATTVAANRWKIDFPAYFNASAPYVHLTDTSLTVREFTYSGVAASIPVTVYSQNASLVDQAVVALPGYFRELESTYGAYGHPTFVAYLSGAGGMEHQGAAVTDLGALDHELLHSWFARGVLPSDGRSGWIDEAIASWRDYGYLRQAWPGTRAATNLAAFSAFERFTPQNCYRDGRALMAELDGLLAPQGGLRPALREFFDMYRHRTVSTPLFQLFLETRAGLSLESSFQAAVYGSCGETEDVEALAADSFREDRRARLPREKELRLTAEQIRELR